MEKRRERRVKQRVICELWLEGSRHSGIVLDRSTHGMFVKTNATPRPGTPVRVCLRDGSDDETFEGTVVRKRVVPQRLNRITSGGVGIRFQFDTRSDFQVRLKQTIGPRTRTLRVASESEEEAREIALSEIGDGWSVLEVSLN